MKELYAALNNNANDWFNSNSKMNSYIALTTVNNTLNELGIKLDTFKCNALASDYYYKCIKMLHLP